MLGLVVDRLMHIKKRADNGTVFQMFENGAETIIIGSAANVVHATVLA